MKLIKIATAIMVLCAIVFLSVSCSSKSTTTVKTQVVTAQKGSISVAVTGTGNLALARTESLAFEMAGYVEAVLVEEGETVQKGQELVKLDTSEWQTQLKTLEKVLETSERTLTARQKALTAAEQAVTTRENAVAKAGRQVSAKEFAVKQAELAIQTANNTLNEITVVKKAYDNIQQAELNLTFIKKLAAGDFGGWAIRSTGDLSLQVTNAKNDLAAAQEDYATILDGTSVKVTSDIALQLAQSNLSIEQSKIALEDAQIAVNDANLAVEDARSAVDDARSSVTDAQLDLNDAQTAVADARDTLDEAKNLSPVITAPFDGFISSVKVSGGDEAQKGTIAMVIADPDQFSAKILVTEEDIFSVKLGGDATVSLTALSDTSFPAEVIKISPTASVSSGVVNYSVTVNITSLQPIIAGQSTTGQLPAQSANRTAPAGMPSGNFTAPAAAPQTTTSMTSAGISLKDGLSAVVEIISQQKSNILVIPGKAITRKNQQSTVQVVKGTGTETRVVTTGMTDGTYTEITDGLTEGEQVVITTASGSSSASGSTKTTTAQQSLQGLSGGGQGGPPPGGF